MMDKSEIKLLPCPFCGAQAVVKRGKTVMVSCSDCTAATFQSLSDEASAIAAWNKRSAPTSADSQELPPLPYTEKWMSPANSTGVIYYYTADQMRDYARAALAAPKQPAAEIDQLRAQNAHLVALYDAVANLVKVKGRHNTEQAYTRLVAAFDAARDDRPAPMSTLTDEQIKHKSAALKAAAALANLANAIDDDGLSNSMKDEIRVIVQEVDALSQCRAVLAAAQGEKP